MFYNVLYLNIPIQMASNESTKLAIQGFRRTNYWQQKSQH